MVRVCRAREISVFENNFIEIYPARFFLFSNFDSNNKRILVRGFRDTGVYARLEMRRKSSRDNLRGRDVRRHRCRMASQDLHPARKLT